MKGAVAAIAFAALLTIQTGGAECPYQECQHKKGCMSTLLKDAADEIVFLQTLVDAHKALEDVMRDQIANLREARHE